MSANGTGIGASVKRKEDTRFLTGRGRYTDDINLPGQLYGYILRSPVAHANIGGIDTGAAAAAPGVHAIFTGKDMEGVGGIPTGWLIHNKDGSPMVEPGHPALALGKVRYVGDCVAIVVAETRDQAKEAANLIDVDYQELPAVASIEAAEAEGAAQVFDEAPDNVCYDWEVGDRAATDAAFDEATHVVSIDVVNNRLVPNAIEPRAAIANFDPATGDYTLYTTSQNPHLIRLLLGAFVLGLPEHKLRIVAPDVGGGFGSKIPHYAEEAILTWTAGQLGRPVKWTCERIDAFKSDTHGRDHISTARLALDADGKFLGLHVSTKANLGAYLSTFATCVPTYLYGILFAGPYTTPAVYCEVKSFFTNTVPVDALRGAGRPEATYLLERLVDKAAVELGMDRVEIRRQNFIREFPYQTPVALSTTRATTTPRSIWRWTRLTGRASRRGGRSRRRRASSAGSGFRPSSRRAGSRLRRSWGRWARGPGFTNRAASGCIPRARCRCSQAHTAMDRATRPRSRRSSPTCSGSTSRRWTWCTATRPRSRSGWGHTVRARWRWAGPRSTWRSRR